MCSKGSSDIQKLHLKRLIQTLRQRFLTKEICLFRYGLLYSLFAYRKVLWDVGKFAYKYTITSDKASQYSTHESKTTFMSVSTSSYDYTLKLCTICYRNILQLKTYRFFFKLGSTTIPTPHLYCL